MTEPNPFEKQADPVTQAYASGPSNQYAKPPIPTGLMVISIIGLLLGLFGILGTCAGGIGLFASSALTDLMPDEEAKKAMTDLMDLQFIPSIIQLLLGLVVSPILIAGCIGCLVRKPWGQGLMKLALMGSILSAVVGLGIAVWMTMFHIDLIAAPNAGQLGKEQATSFAYLGQIIGILMQVAFLGFYFWALMYMGSKKVNDFFDQVSGSGK